MAGEQERVRKLLSEPRTVAVVGMSSKPERYSRKVGLYLKNHGFNIIPVHPSEDEVEGMMAYESLGSIPDSRDIDIAAVFVSPEKVGDIAEEAAEAGADILWFQPGAENPEQEERGRQKGLEVFSGRCLMADHARMFGA
jgi:predicted CoA-binding protein